jgi:hypothetical protein
MWGHYADDHKGFCIEYDLEQLAPEDAMLRNLYPVIYSKDLYDMTPYVNGLVVADRSNYNPFAPLLSVLHKFEGWKYEREWRLIMFAHALRPDHTQKVPKPSRVFLGWKMDATNAAEVSAICARQGINVFKMNLARDNFELIAHPYVVPRPCPSVPILRGFAT